MATRRHITIRALCVTLLTLAAAGCVTSARSRYERQLTATVRQSPIAALTASPTTDVAARAQRPPTGLGVLPGPMP